MKFVGIAEPDRELALRYSKQYGFSMDIVFNTLDEMILKTRPQAVTAFNSIVEHLDVVKACAPKGIHVMVEKPLSFNLDHARQMEALATKHKIHLLTNFETTWYGSNHKAYSMLFNDHALVTSAKLLYTMAIAVLRKLVWDQNFYHG